MNPGECETQEEYDLSKELIFAFMNSADALDTCDGLQPVVDISISFVRSYVIVYEEQFIFTRKNIYNTSTSKHPVVMKEPV